MTKTQEQLSALKEEAEKLNKSIKQENLMSDKSHPGFVMSGPGGSKTVCG